MTRTIDLYRVLLIFFGNLQQLQIKPPESLQNSDC
jgi:hypothetical protein